MKVKLRIAKDASVLYEGQFDICDADSFGSACENAWLELREQRLSKATSIGALFEALDDELLGDLVGATISLSRA